METLKLLKYNSKLIFSKRYVIFILGLLIFPLSLNLSNVMHFEMTFPIFGMFIFSNIMLIDREHNTEKIFYMSKISKSKILLIRLFINSLFYFVSSIFFYIYLKFIIKNDFLDAFSNSNDISLFKMVFVLGFINFLLFGLISLTVANITKNYLIGMIASAAYWGFWIGMYVPLSSLIINPFSYSAGCCNYSVYKVIEIVVILLLIIFNCNYTSRKIYRNQ